MVGTDSKVSVEIRSVGRTDAYPEISRIQILSTVLLKFLGTHQFNPSTLLRPLYFDQNCTSTCTSRPIRSTDLQKGRSTGKVEYMKMVEVKFNPKTLANICESKKRRLGYYFAVLE